MKKALTLVLFLGIISAIAGLGVGAVNSITAPLIEERLLAAERENLELMFPGAEFSAIEGVSDEGGYVTGVFEVVNEGYAVKMETTGYSSSTPIILLVGFDNDGVITNVMALQEQETDGFGSKVFEDDNIQSAYVGKGLDDTVDLLSGATVTSTAVQNAITSAQAMLKDIIG